MEVGLTREASIPRQSNGITDPDALSQLHQHAILSEVLVFTQRSIVVLHDDIIGSLEKLPVGSAFVGVALQPHDFPSSRRGDLRSNGHGPIDRVTELARMAEGAEESLRYTIGFARRIGERVDNAVIVFALHGTQSVIPIVPPVCLDAGIDDLEAADLHGLSRGDLQGDWKGLRRFHVRQIRGEAKRDRAQERILDFDDPIRSLGNAGHFQILRHGSGGCAEEANQSSKDRGADSGGHPSFQTGSEMRDKIQQASVKRLPRRLLGRM